MARLVVMYGMQKDPAAFDKYYADIHIPLAKKIPGVRRFEVSRGPVMTPTGPSKYHLFVTLDFDDIAAPQNGLGSPEGQAAAADVQNFATGSVEMLVYDNQNA